ncbi:MAG: hypothetical protein ACKPGW_23205 [Microcystis panniformis]
MVAILGNTENEDGVVGTTGADDKSGVFGRANSQGWGVFGFSERGYAGVFGSGAQNGVFGQTNNLEANGVYGKNDGGGVGVFGQSLNGAGAGVLGRNEGSGWGVHGHAEGTGFAGVFGSGANVGVFGLTHNGESSAVHGRNNGVNPTGAWGVFGFSEKGFAGVFGSGAQNGVFGQTNAQNASGVYGRNDGNGNGVLGSSDGGGGVAGFSNTHNGVFGQSETGSGLHGYSKQQFGIYARSDTGMAGFFEGSITVTNDIILKNADCAENFDIAGLEKVEPGTVMVIDSEGALCPSNKPYDKRVAGVISGAGLYKPGLILDKQESSENRMPIALMGKVYCKVDASYGAIEVGDLLTTSPTPGHAMKAEDPMKAFGSVIGKALRPLNQGKQGLIPILIALQ